VRFVHGKGGVGREKRVLIRKEIFWFGEMRSIGGFMNKIQDYFPVLNE